MSFQVLVSGYVISVSKGYYVYEVGRAHEEDSVFCFKSIETLVI